jgi:hypothetical protein
MKRASIFYLISAIATCSFASFFIGLHSSNHVVTRQLANALNTQLVCTASSLKDNVAVASLLDKEDGGDARDILIVGIKSSVAKLKAFGPYLDGNDQAMVMDALKDGETYLSKIKEK